MKLFTITLCLTVAGLLAFQAQAQPYQDFNNWTVDSNDKYGGLSIFNYYTQNDGSALVAYLNGTLNFPENDRPRQEVYLPNFVKDGYTYKFKFDVYINTYSGNGSEAGGCFFQLFPQNSNSTFDHNGANFLLRTAGADTIYGYVAGNYSPAQYTDNLLASNGSYLDKSFTFEVQICCSADANTGYIKVWGGEGADLPDNEMKYLGVIKGANMSAASLGGKGCVVKCGTYCMGSPDYANGIVEIWNMTAQPVN